YGLAGMRIGYVIAAQEAIEKWNIIRPPFNVGRLSEHAALAALEDQDYLDSIREKNAQERAKFFDSVSSHKLNPSQTNFFFLNTLRPNELYVVLLKQWCITREFPNCVKSTISLSEQNDKMI